jgi:DNA-binding CsgD family transcriptional regulator
MARGATVLTSVRRIYDAALTADAWQPALQSVVELLGGDHAILVARDPTREGAAMATSAGMDDRDFAHLLSPQAARLMAPYTSVFPPGSATLSSRLIRDRDFERTELYNEVVRSVRGFYAVAVRDETPGLSSFMTVCRSRKRGDFDAADAIMMQSLAPHLTAALRLRRRLDAADLSAAGAWAALEHLGTGVMIVDAAGSVAFANETATGLFRDGYFRLDRDGLRVLDAASCVALRRIIADCVAAEPKHGSGNTVDVTGGDRLPPLRVVGVPFQPQRLGFDAVQRTEPFALLLISNPQQEWATRKEQLRSRFGLTSAEANLAIEIARGDGRAAAAARLGIAVTTARTHLTHIFEKTGVHRQAELVRLVLQRPDGATQRDRTGGPERPSRPNVRPRRPRPAPAAS